MIALKLEEKLDKYLANGQISITRDELRALNYSESGLRKAINRVKENERLMEPREGFLVIVPPRYRNRGVPPNQFIDELMNYESRDYYVGLLSAAQSHGAQHQSPMVFQVVIRDERPDIELERSTIQFITNSIEFSPEMTDQKKTRTGYFSRSTPEVTVVDSIYYQKRAGGLSNVAGIIAELHDQLDPKTMLDYALRAHGRSTVQRLGYILETLGLSTLSIPFQDFAHEKDPAWVALNPSGSRSGHTRNSTYNLIVNYPLEPDVTPSSEDNAA